MADDAGNAATFTWGATSGVTQGKVTSLSYGDNGNEIDVTAFGDSAHEYLIAIPDLEITVEMNGITSLTRGSTGTATIMWGNATSTESEVGVAVITAIEKGNTIDGPTTSSLTFKPYGG